MNPKIGDRYKFKDIIEHGLSTVKEKPNEFEVTAVTEGQVSLRQSGCAEAARFSRANFERDFVPLKARAR